MNAAEYTDDDRRITYFAATNTRGKREMFGIRAKDRSSHIYVIGKTGMGKSTLLENMAIQDIQNGEGLSFIDPHGATAEKLLDFIPYERVDDVVYFAPFDTDHPIGFNIMEDVGYDKRHLVVSGLMGALKRIWVDAWSARMEYILQNTLLALLEYPESTLLDVNKMLTNKLFRATVVEKVTDPIVRAFWTEEFAQFTDSYTREATPAIQNKVGQFTANPLIRNIVGQPRSSFDLRKMMDERKIFIVNLSKGRMGETNASLLGSMLTVKIYLAAMSRADEPARVLARLPRHYFYVDEFQSMMNEAFADILSESRKYKLALTLANQYIEQMEENVRDAVFGNVGTLICFRVGPFDAETLKVVFEPTFTAEDLIGIGIGQIYLTLMIDGVGSAPFSAETIPPIEAPRISYREDVINHSRALFCRPRGEIEATITQKQLDFAQPVKKAGAPAPRRAESARHSGTQAANSPLIRASSPSRAEERFVRASPPPASAAPARQGHASREERYDGRWEDRRAGEGARSSLRAAIEAARVSGQGREQEPQEQVLAAGRTPADILRAKQAARSTAAPKSAADGPRNPQFSNPAPRPAPKREDNVIHEDRGAEKRPESARAPEKNGRSGEVAREVLEQVLGGTGGN